MRGNLAPRPRPRQYGRGRGRVRVMLGSDSASWSLRDAAYVVVSTPGFRRALPAKLSAQWEGRGPKLQQGFASAHPVCSLCSARAAGGGGGETSPCLWVEASSDARFPRFPSVM